VHVRRLIQKGYYCHSVLCLASRAVKKCVHILPMIYNTQYGPIYFACIAHTQSVEQIAGYLEKPYSHETYFTCCSHGRASTISLLLAGIIQNNTSRAQNAFTPELCFSVVLLQKTCTSRMHVFCTKTCLLWSADAFEI
jgi:hypothetical protein